MNRTGVILPEFTRMLWVSDVAKSVWEPRITQIGQYLIEMERADCLKGRTALQFVRSDELPDLIKWAGERKLAVFLVDVTAEVNTYRAGSAAYVKGQPYTIRVAIAPIFSAQKFMKAWQDRDDRAIGNYLGYPPCCCRFFERVWVEEKYLDTTWPMAMSTELRADPREIDIAFDNHECNILLRWAGVRAVPHLPCSFNCKLTKISADVFNQKDRQEYVWIMEILSWPVEWSALHGIARIKTPIFEISTRTDHTDEKYTVRRYGMSYPKEGARGLVFPFDAAPSRSAPEQEASLWTDNGFSSLEAMERAHKVLVDLATEVKNKVISVHDLGCGNGLLLEKLSSLQVALSGVDLKKVDRWRSTAHFTGGNLLDYRVLSSPSLGLMSVNRIEEFSSLVDDAKLEKLVNSFTYFILYSYDGKPVFTLPGWEMLSWKHEGEVDAKLLRRES